MVQPNTFAKQTLDIAAPLFLFSDPKWCTIGKIIPLSVAMIKINNENRVVEKGNGIINALSKKIIKQSNKAEIKKI